MSLRSLIVALMLVLAGCATVDRVQEKPPAIVVSQSTWRQVDREIVTASQSATDQAKVYARGSMEHWRSRVYEQTEEQFIPWFSSYWTQEWLEIKVSWYALSASGEHDRSASRLAVYLQEQYHDRVLAPVAVEVDPDTIMAQATEFYIQLMGKQLQGIALRYHVPAEQFDRRLNDFLVITLAPPPTRNASLYQLIHADPLAKQPAYEALMTNTQTTVGGTEVVASQAAISSVAKRTSEKLEAQFASRGIGSAVAAAVGRVAGLVISVGMAGVRAISHESDRPDMEAQLRQNLGSAFDEAWLGMMKNPNTGVMAGVHYLAGKIEGHFAEPQPSAQQDVPGPTESLRQDGTEPVEYWRSW